MCESGPQGLDLIRPGRVQLSPFPERARLESQRRHVSSRATFHMLRRVTQRLLNRWHMVRAQHVLDLFLFPRRVEPSGGHSTL